MSIPRFNAKGFVFMLISTPESLAVKRTGFLLFFSNFFASDFVAVRADNYPLENLVS